MPHNVWITSIEDNNKIIKATAEMFMTYLPNAKIIPVLGNHETHPVNLYVHKISFIFNDECFLFLLSCLYFI